MAAAPSFPLLYYPRIPQQVESKLDHLIAQFRWNLTWATPEETLAEEGEGAACLTAVTGDRMRYMVHLKDMPARKIEVTTSLAGELLPLGVTKLCFKREREQRSFSQTYFQGLFELEREGLDWMKVGAFYVDRIGRMCVTALNQGDPFPEGSAKRLARLESRDGEKRVRARYFVDEKTVEEEFRQTAEARWGLLRVHFEKLKRLAPRMWGCKQLLVPEFYWSGEREFGMIMPELQEDFFNYLQREGSSSIEQNYRIARDVAVALSWLHKREVVHLDVKPDNVLVRNKCGVKRGVLTDLDFCWKIEEGKAVPSSGSRDYVDPNLMRQQAFGRVDAIAADLFSLGVLLHICAAQLLPLRSTLDKREARALSDRCVNTEIANLDIQALLITLLVREGLNDRVSKLSYHPEMPQSMDEMIER